MGRISGAVAAVTGPTFALAGLIADETVTLPR